MAPSQQLQKISEKISASQEAEYTEQDGKKKDKWKDVGIERTGDKIVLPEGMSFDEGIKWLQRKKEEDERVIAINEQVDAYPVDGAHALWVAISRKYGFAGLIPTPGFWSDTPPAMIGVPTGPDTSVQVPWGRMQIPNIAGFIETWVDQKEGRHIFVIGGEVKQKHKKEVAELAALTRKIVKEESIYRGKAIRVNFPELSPRDFNPTSQAPKFMDTRTVSIEELVFSMDVALLVKDSLFTSIEKTEMCRQYKIPLKRGILLEGPYGTGKTLTAYVTAKKAVENGWTFIYLKDVKDLQRAIYFGQQYGPAVIFAEDIDQVLKGGRDDAMNGILNTIDGVDTKGSELIVVLTTNHIELIHPAMLRPGRLDAVIPIRPPDSVAVTRLIKLYARGLVSEGENLEPVGEILGGHIPAVIREVVERSKLSAVGRLEAGQPLKLFCSDLVSAAKSMMAQVNALNRTQAPAPTPMQELGTAIGDAHVTGAAKLSELTKLVPAEVIDALAKGNGAVALKNGNGTNGSTKK